MAVAACNRFLEEKDLDNDLERLPDLFSSLASLVAFTFAIGVAEEMRSRCVAPL